MRRFRINKYGEIVEEKPRRRVRKAAPKRHTGASRPRMRTGRPAAQRESHRRRPYGLITALIIAVGLLISTLIVCVGYSQSCEWAVDVHDQFVRMLRQIQF